MNGGPPDPAEFQAGGVTGDDSFLIPQGAILDRDLDTVHAVDPQASEEIQEYISHSWYDSSHDKDTPLHPYEGETKPLMLELKGEEPLPEPIPDEKKHPARRWVVMSRTAIPGSSHPAGEAGSWRPALWHG